MQWKNIMIRENGQEKCKVVSTRKIKKANFESK